jgi:hypothetical protein
LGVALRDLQSIVEQSDQPKAQRRGADEERLWAERFMIKQCEHCPASKKREHERGAAGCGGALFMGMYFWAVVADGLADAFALLQPKPKTAQNQTDEERPQAQPPHRREQA